MTMRGRPATPITERIAALAGTAVAGVKPSPLENTNPFDRDTEIEAWRLWEYVVPELIERYSVGRGDQPIIEAMCRYYLRWYRARDEYGSRMTYMDDMGNIKKHPAVTIEDASWKEFSACAQQLGLTPMARPRIKPFKEPDKGADQPFSILSFSRDRQGGPPPPDEADGVQDAG